MKEWLPVHLLLIASLLFAQGTSNAVVPVTLTGRISIDDGSPLPTVETFRGPNINFGLSAMMPGQGGQLADASTKADGTFEVKIETADGIGQFNLITTRIPLGLYLKSMSYGAVDLLTGPLTVGRDRTPDEVRVVLTKTPPTGTGGVKLSGRVTKLENAVSGLPLTISLQTTPAGSNVLRLGVIRVNADGTFEVDDVPAGRYLIRSQPGTNPLRELIVADQEMSGVEIALTTAGTRSLLITSGPLTPFSGTVLPARGSLSTIQQPTTSPAPPDGAALLSVTQTVNQPGRKYYEGAISFYRIERSGQLLDERHVDGGPVTFRLTPGNYELTGYFRACDGSCRRLDAPEVVCKIPFSVNAGEVLYAERLVQNDACVLRVFAP